MKARPEHYRGALSGRFLALILEKPSLRTRVTFRWACESMGGAAVFLDHTVSRLGRARIHSRRGAESVALGAGDRGARLRAAGAGAAGANTRTFR